MGPMVMLAAAALLFVPPTPSGPFPADLDALGAPQRAGVPAHLAPPSTDRPQPPGRLLRRSRKVCLTASRRAARRRPAPPPLRLSAESKLQLAVLVGSGMLVQMAVGVIVPVLPLFASSVGLSASDVGLLVALPSMAKLCFNLPMGLLVDSAGRKAPLVIGVLLDGIGSLATASARRLVTVAPARLLVGIGNSGAVVAEQAYLMDVVSKYPEHKGFLLGTVQSMLLLAFAAGPALGGIMATHGSTRLPFWVIGGLLIATAPLYALLPETHPRQPPSRRAARGRPQRWAPQAYAATCAAIEGAVASYKKLLTQRPQIALLASRFGLTAGWAVWLTIVPLAAAESWAASPGDLGRLYSIITILGFAVAPVGGKLADRFGAARMTTVGALMSSAAVGLLSIANSKLSFYVCMALWDAGESAMSAALNAYAAEVTFENQRGAANSLSNQVQDAVFVVLPILLGFIGGRVSNAAALVFGSFLMIASAAFFAVLA
ncbi:hypothetical protein AB1Y20_019897 [Prymnesium parvum]|uniref:Major facilitator superfamily (MFS) profile domain-containing protein n=1 Tax=Prymnesium parvum TaxID=97485 RepID=A0AB34JVC0_PRYPA